MLPFARPPQYQHTTLLEFRTALALRLQDSGYVYWGSGEMDGFIVAALRTWQALTGSYSDRGVFSTVANQAFYDLGAVLASLYGYTVTDAQIVQQIQHLLLEPAGIPWTGSNQFTLSQILQAIQKRRDQFLRDSGMVVVLLSDTYQALTPDNSVEIPDTVIAVRRAAWLNADGVYKPLYRTDEWGARGFSQSTTPGTPYSYSVAVSPPVSLSVYPPPVDTGAVQLCVIQAGANLDGTGIFLGVPDDFSQYVMFGALADLLGADGQCRDPQRAQYAESRYQEGVMLGRMFPSGLQVQVSSQPIRVGSTGDFDGFSRNWQNTRDIPSACGFTGRNLLALKPVPDDVYSVSVDGVRNMPVPSASDDFIQVGLDSLDAVLGYAQHLASFKMGGQEFVNTQAQFSQFMQAAGRMNRKLQAEAFYTVALDQPAVLQGYRVPVETRS